MSRLYAIKKVVARHVPRPCIDWYLEHRWPLYLGRRYHCNLCNTSFRTMVPGGSLEPVCNDYEIIGMGYQPNMTCPRCGTINRWRLLTHFIREKTDLLTAPRSLLHMAPEVHLQSIFRACPTLQYLSADLDNPIAMRKMDITRLDLADRTFDAVICSHVLEHIPDDLQAMRELFRVLKPGGWAILQVPVSPRLMATFEDASILSPEDRNRCYGQPDHVRIYGQDYPERLRLAGFSVKVYNALATFGHVWVDRHAVDPREDVFFCTRPA